MLDPKKYESTNELNICGILNELEIKEGQTGDGRKYVRGKATIRVDQEVYGEMCENTVPISMFAMQKKSDGSENPFYERIKNYPNEFTSAGAVDDISQATKIYVGGKAARLEENSFVGKDGTIVPAFQISSNFLNKARNTDADDVATFELTGVIGKMIPEYNKQSEETGRLIVKFIVIGYGGRANCIDLIAQDTPSGAAKTFIENNWEEGDTVSVGGVIKWSFKTETWEEEQGFGEPIKRSKTVSCRELLITKGSASGLEEDASYDPNLIKVALQERQERMNDMVNKSKSNAAAKPAAKKGTGFPDF